jgi:hypothetical protein
LSGDLGFPDALGAYSAILPIADGELDLADPSGTVYQILE